MSKNNGKVLSIETSEEISERVTIISHEHFTFRITYWELPGKERHLNFLNNYCLGSAVAIVLFDTTKSSSLEKAEKILKSIENAEIPIKILLCNKMDLLNTKQNITNPVVHQDAKTLAANHGCIFMTCNSTAVNFVNDVLKQVMDDIYKHIGTNLELRNLIGKNISVGKKLFDHPNFLQSLKDAQYFKD